MATKPTTQTDSKTKKADDSTTPKADAVKTEATATETPAATTDADGSSGGGSKKSSAPSRPISYFSSVSTNEYRSGWDDIFSAGGKKGARKAGKSTAANRNNKLPVTITLDADDLNEATRLQLEALFRQDAKKKRLNYDKLSGNGQVRWEISCNISD